MSNHLIITSPLYPFTDTRWRRSPTPEFFPGDCTTRRHPFLERILDPSSPSPIFTELRSQIPISGPSSNGVQSQSIESEPSKHPELGGCSQSSTPNSLPDNPGISAWQSSPFKDHRWKTWAYSVINTEQSEAESLGPLTPHTTPSGRKGSFIWKDSPFRDERWRTEPLESADEGVKEIDWTDSGGDYWDDGMRVWLEGLTGSGSVGDPQEGSGDVARGRSGTRAEYSDSEESEGVQRLRRNLWPATEKPRRELDTQFDYFHSPISAGPRIDQEAEQDYFWQGPRIGRPSSIQSSSPHSSVAYSPHPEVPIRDRPLSPLPSSRERHVLPNNHIHLATHLSARRGHVQLLADAERLIHDENMSGLSMFLYCPKKHVRDIWSDTKIEAMREGLDRLEKACPGFISRTLVHAHETINLACPSPGPGTSGADDQVYRDTIEGLSIEMKTMERLGLKHLVVHPGSSIRCGGKGDDPKTIGIIAANIVTLLERHPSITIVLESMTCTRSRLAGTSLPSLASIRSQSSYPSRIKFCLDLSHVHSSSHDLSTLLGRKTFFADVDQWLGPENVICGHVSECGVPHGSGRDVHADFGSGYIGDSAFRDILTYPSFGHVTWIIETPRYLPYTLSSRTIEMLEVDRQALDLRHLRYLSSTPKKHWEDLENRSKIGEDREEAIKMLKGKMWAEVRRKGGLEEGMWVERRKRERKRRARIGNARARARLIYGREEGERLEMDDLGVKRSPKRDKEALLAMIARKKRRMRGTLSVLGRFV